MPWFITSIRTISSKRTFGFFNSYHDAYQAVIKNSGDIQERLYNYCVIEYMEEGIHPEVHKAVWFRWCEDDWKWVFIENCPEELVNVSNWALG